MDRAVAALRMAIGVYFVMSGLANYLHFSGPDGFLAQVRTMPLRLWGLGYGWDEGAFSLPALLAVPLAWALPGVEIAQGLLFTLGRAVVPVGWSMIGVLATIVLAFGLFPPELLQGNTMSFNKDVIFMVAIYAVIAWSRQQAALDQIPQRPEQRAAANAR